MNMDLDAATKEAPTLTLDPFAEAKAEIVEKKPEELVEEQAVPEMELTPEEQKMVDDFAGQIDLTNTQAVLQYGAGSQKKIADFSETALSNVRTKDMGEVGQLLTDVVAGSEILTGKNKDTAPGEGGTWKRTQAPVGKEALHE